MLDGEADPQSENGLASVFVLAASLVRLCGDACRAVSQDDGRLDLIAMLPARSGPARADLVAFPSE